MYLYMQFSDDDDASSSPLEGRRVQITFVPPLNLDLPLSPLHHK